MSESEKNLKKFATALKDAIQAPKISASRIGACAEYAYRCNNSKEKAAEVSKRLLKEVGSCGDSKRLCAIYVIDAVLGKCDRKLGKKSVYPRLLKAKLEDSFDLAAYCSADEKKQIVKVLSKWRSLGLFQESLINSWAQKATVVLPTDNDDASKSKDKSTFKEDEKTVLRVDSAISNTSFMSGTYEVEKNDVKIGSDTQIERRSHKRQRKSRWDTDTSTSDAPAITAENMPTGPQPPPYRPAQPRPPAISLDLGIGTSREKEKEVHEDTNTDTDTNAHASDYTLSPNKPTQSHIVNTASSNAIAGGWGAYSGTGNTTNPIHSMATSTAVTGGWGKWAGQTQTQTQSVNHNHNHNNQFNTHDMNINRGGFNQMPMPNTMARGRGIPKASSNNIVHAQAHQFQHPHFGAYNPSNFGNNLSPPYQQHQQQQPTTVNVNKPKPKNTASGWGAFTKK